MTPRDLNDDRAYEAWDRDHGTEWAGVGVDAEDPDPLDALLETTWWEDR